MAFEMICCNLCGSDDLTRFGAGTRNLNLIDDLGVSRCRRCGLLFLNPRPNQVSREKILRGEKVNGLEDYTSKKANYSEVTNSRIPIFKRRVQRVTKQYFQNVPGKVLDIGASSGEFLDVAKKLGWSAHGVEPSVDGIRNLKEKGFEANLAQAENLPFEDAEFDWVHSNHVFEHLADPLTSAKEAYRVLKPGGIIFIEVPNQFDNIQFFRYRLMGIIPVRERNIRSIHHFFFFSKRTLKILLRNADFQEIQINDYFGSKRKGFQSLGSDLVRFFGRFYLGGPFIQAIAKKR